MEFFTWLNQNWFILLQSVGIIASLIFTGLALRLDVKSRRIGNLIDLTQGHREIWSQLYRRPDLARVLDPKADLTDSEVTESERIFVTLVVTHLNSIYHALTDRLTVQPDELRQDVRSLFSLPIPNAVWEQIKSLQDREFVRFVEACLSSEQNSLANRQ